MAFHQPSNPSRNAQIAAANAAHVVAWMTIDTINGNVQLASSVENGLVGLPVAAPFLVIPNPIQKLLFGYRAGHPRIQNFLVPRKNRLNGERNSFLGTY